MLGRSEHYENQFLSLTHSKAIHTIHDRLQWHKVAEDLTKQIRRFPFRSVIAVSTRQHVTRNYCCCA